MTISLTLPAELTIYTAAELQPLYLGWTNELARDGHGQVDGEFMEVMAEAVTEVDAAGVQLLLSLSHTVARAGRTLRLVDPSPCLSSACAALGVGGLCHPGSCLEVAP